jgi:hypothetical protein
MTRRDLEYIYYHYLASVNRLTKNCVGMKCRKCPFADKDYRPHCHMTIDIRKAMKTIGDFLAETDKEDNP